MKASGKSLINASTNLSGTEKSPPLTIATLFKDLFIVVWNVTKF